MVRGGVGWLGGIKWTICVTRSQLYIIVIGDSRATFFRRPDYNAHVFDSGCLINNVFLCSRLEVPSPAFRPLPSSSSPPGNPLPSPLSGILQRREIFPPVYGDKETGADISRYDTALSVTLARCFKIEPNKLVLPRRYVLSLKFLCVGLFMQAGVIFGLNSLRKPLFVSQR